MKSPQLAERPLVRPVAGQRLVGGHGSYLQVHDFSRADRIDLVKEGVPARLLVTVAEDMQVTRDRLYLWLGIARATANRKIKANDALSQDESERALAIARLIGQIEKIVAESGNTNGFDAATWTAVWLARPNSALGGKTPGDYLDTADGRACRPACRGRSA